MTFFKGVICILPFVVFYWMLPFYGTMTIGNDYPRFAITQQMELQYSLARGSFPLYAPGFAGGRSAAALTLGGMYHPLSHLAAHSPGYWNGGALEWNTFWRLVSLGLTQLVLFNLLRRLELSTDFAFVVSFITVYNLRTLDMFRYGASLENYLGFLLLFAAMTNLYLAPDSAIRALLVIGATYLMICGGHPQIAYRASSCGTLGSCDSECRSSAAAGPCYKSETHSIVLWEDWRIRRSGLAARDRLYASFLY